MQFDVPNISISLSQKQEIWEFPFIHKGEGGILQFGAPIISLSQKHEKWEFPFMYWQYCDTSLRDKGFNVVEWEIPAEGWECRQHFNAHGRMLFKKLLLSMNIHVVFGDSTVDWLPRDEW